MKEAAHKVHRLLEVEAGEALLAVGYVSEAEREAVFISEYIEERYSEEDIEAVLEAAFFESLGGQLQEELHASELHATTRTFDEMTNTVVPLSGRECVTFALAREGEYSYRTLINLIEAVVADEKLGLEISGS